MHKLYAEGTYLSFRTFSFIHLITLGIIAAVCISFFIFKKYYQNLEDGKLAFGVTGRAFTAVLIFQQLSLYVWYYYAGKFNFSTYLPFQLCGASVYLCILLWITKSRLIFEIVYFWGLCGAMQALITPDLEGYNFPHFRFLQFFSGHGLIIITIMYFVAVKGWKVDFKSLIKSFIALQAIALCAFGANYLTGGNYMYLAAKPAAGSIMNFMPKWPYYIIVLEFTALVFMAVALIPFYIKPVKEKVLHKI